MQILNKQTFGYHICKKAIKPKVYLLYHIKLKIISAVNFIIIPCVVQSRWTLIIRAVPNWWFTWWNVYSIIYFYHNLINVLSLSFHRYYRINQLKHLKCILRITKDLGAVSIRKTVLLGMAIPILKIRRPIGRLIFNMGIPIPRKTVFYIETGPWWQLKQCRKLYCLLKCNGSIRSDIIGLNNGL